MSNVMDLNTESIPQFSIAPSSSFDQYHRTLRATLPPFKQTGKGSCDEVNNLIEKKEYFSHVLLFSNITLFFIFGI